MDFCLLMNDFQKKDFYLKQNILISKFLLLIMIVVYKIFITLHPCVHLLRRDVHDWDAEEAMHGVE